jgi:CRISPR-associated protein (TIGR02584 family)
MKTMSKEKKRRILLAVSGMSPQIITETLYGLLHNHEVPWIPDEIHLITTSEGREQVRLQLLGEQGYFTRFLRDYMINAQIRFDQSTIHVITDCEGQILHDLRTPKDNEAAADYITEKIRELTSQSNSELHVSLAGGRKTMGFYIGYALSLFGRPQDRLSHVLVTPEYESLSEFYYPTPISTRISSKDGKRVLDAAQAQVYLAQIPFVRLRGFLPEQALVSNAGFSELVELVTTLTNEPTIVVCPKLRSVEVGSIQFTLPPREMALYIVFLRLIGSKKREIAVPKKGSASMRELYLSALQQVKGEMGDLDATQSALGEGMPREYFDSIKSRLNKSLERVLGTTGSKPYQIQNKGRGSATFFVSIPDEKIKIKELY